MTNIGLVLSTLILPLLQKVSGYRIFPDKEYTNSTLPTQYDKEKLQKTHFFFLNVVFHGLCEMISSFLLNLMAACLEFSWQSSSTIHNHNKTQVTD